MLGLALAQKHPEWLYAYIGMGQMIDTRASERLGYAGDARRRRRPHTTRRRSRN